MTKFKFLCILLALFISADAFAQLRPVTRTDGNNGDEDCLSLGGTYCIPFSLPTDHLTFDASDDGARCNPVNNFGCDLHIGLTFEGSGATTYVQITSCVVHGIDTANNVADYNPDWDEPYPTICVAFSANLGKGIDCEDVRPSFSLNLYCRDENGDFTPLSDIAADNPDDDWASILPNSEVPGELIGGNSWRKKLCCDDIMTDGGEVLSPFIGQNDDGSVIYIRNFPDIDKVSVSIFDANNQSVDGTFDMNRISDHESSVNLSALQQGIYFIRASDNINVSGKTIVKM